MYDLIENHGVIGDLNTIALVCLNGTIDYMCFPNFDSPSIFASLLDDKKGGNFELRPTFTHMNTRQLYLPDTNVLLTRFLSEEGVAEITDFMPVEELYAGKEIVRRVTAIRGEVTFKMKCMPRFNYGRSGHKVEEVLDTEMLFISDEEEPTRLRLVSSVALAVKENDVVAKFTLMPGQTADFLLEHIDNGHSRQADFKAFVTESLFETVNYWKDWIAQSKYKGRWLDVVNRSALLLKLLTSYKYGSIVAAPTFSLPENIGGSRNFDYRFTWIRDASFSMYALIKMGYTKEAGAFINWIENVCQDTKGESRLGVMYNINGKQQLEEHLLDHLEGYKKSSPVRIGNEAFNQLQLDIYGELMDSVYLYNKYGEPISYDFWKNLEGHLDWLVKNWRRPDEGIWEVRGGQQHFLFSRISCWVAFDRAIRLGQQRSFPLNEQWRTTRDEIFKSVYAEYWNEEKKAFMQFPGAETVDASALLMPLLRFIGPRDPRWLSTMELIEKELVSDSLVYRYNPNTAAHDGFVSHEGTFSMCSFWYVECLSKSGQLEKARFYFEKMLGYANHLGLYSEQLGFHGEHLGNFPQAFTHLGLISAALNLDMQLNDSRNQKVNGSS